MGIAFVQVASATPQSSQTSVKVSYSQPQTAGDLNLVAVGWNDTSATVQSVTDSVGNSYTLAAGPLKGTALTQSIYYAKNILGGSNTVTVTFSHGGRLPRHSNPGIQRAEHVGPVRCNRGCERNEWQ